MTHTITNGKETMSFTVISHSTVEVCYGKKEGSWINNEFYPATKEVQSVEFARNIYQSRMQMGWKKN